MNKVIKSALKPVADFSRKIVRKLMDPIINEIVQETRNSISAASSLAAQRSNCVTPYYCGEKIRILFIFQMASLWPSWESFYESCIKDSRFCVTFTLLKENNPISMSQMLSAESFLQSKGIPYVLYNDALMAKVRPHVVVLQTPYDWYRQRHAQSNILLRYGARLIYITYGIEIADTEHAHKDHFTTAVRNCWRIYTFSDRMRADYAIYCGNGIAARSFGHPKFDALFHKNRFVLPTEVQDRANNRPIFLWHLHFPKFIIQEGSAPVMATPYLSEYLQFIKIIKSSRDFFFIAQIHPKFMDCEEGLRNQARKLIELLENLPNVYIDRNDDYRPCLVCADFIITDRSAIMVEGAAVGVPIQYMLNADYSEPLTEAVKPLVDSYVQGYTAADMASFVEDCRKGIDTQKEAREKAFRECIPYFDGHCGERIKDDIADSLMTPEQRQFMELTNHFKENIPVNEKKKGYFQRDVDSYFCLLNDLHSIDNMTLEEIIQLDSKLSLLEIKIKNIRGAVKKQSEKSLE